MCKINVFKKCKSFESYGDVFLFGKHFHDAFLNYSNCFNALQSADGLVYSLFDYAFLNYKFCYAWYYSYSHIETATLMRISCLEHVVSLIHTISSSSKKKLSKRWEGLLFSCCDLLSKYYFHQSELFSKHASFVVGGKYVLPPSKDDETNFPPLYFSDFSDSPYTKYSIDDCDKYNN